MNDIQRALMVLLSVGLFVLLFFISDASGDNHPKPTSKIEFGISKHGGLHYVNGGFNEFSVKHENRKNIEVAIKINSLWTWQSDTVANDDVNRTKDLLSSDWFHADKYPYAYAYIHELKPSGKFNVTIKGITKLIKYKFDGKHLMFRLVLKDFGIDASWKRIFVGNHADVKVMI